MRYFYEDEQPQIPVKPIVKPRQEAYVRYGSNVNLDKEIAKQARRGRSITGKPLPTPKIK